MSATVSMAVAMTMPVTAPMTVAVAVAVPAPMSMTVTMSMAMSMAMPVAMPGNGRGWHYGHRTDRKHQCSYKSGDESKLLQHLKFFQALRGSSTTL
jgi:hypothetical protein